MTELRLMAAAKLFVLACSFVLLATVYADDVPTLYQGADLKLGEELMAEHQCTACHQRKFGGDGSSIYRPAGKVNSLSALRGMVESCNQQLDFRLFPEEVTSISAVLNRDHYRFK